MKKQLTFVLLTLVLMATGSAQAAIDFAGNMSPASTSNVASTAGLDISTQVYKIGITEPAGQGADISAVINYTIDFVTFGSVAMVYVGDVGNNDEYSGQVPQSVLAGEIILYLEVVFTDASDGSTWMVPFVEYNIVDVLPNDVEVGFSLCLSGETTSGDVCVIGSDPALGSWVTGVTMIDDGGDLYGVSVIIPAGSSPTFEYIYLKDGCSTSESIANRVVTLPVDGTAFYSLPSTDSWNDGAGVCDAVTVETSEWGTFKSLYR